MPILEDDYDCELRLAAPATAGAEDDRRRRPGRSTSAPSRRRSSRACASATVVGARRCSRALAPQPRDRELQQPSLVDQMAVAELLARDALERHVRRVRKRYAASGRAHARGARSRDAAGHPLPRTRGGICDLGRAAGRRRRATRSRSRRAATRHRVRTKASSSASTARPRRRCCSRSPSSPPDAIRAGVAELAALVRRQCARHAARRAPGGEEVTMTARRDATLLAAR